MKLSVVLPCYNEEENVRRIPTELIPVLDEVGLDYEIIVVDDGSSDHTIEEVNKMDLPNLVLVQHGVNKGLGAALRTGLATATGSWIIFLDSDFTFHPRIIKDLVYEKNSSGADFIVGSPFLGGYGKDIPWWRLWISKAAGTIYNLLLDKKITAINQILRLYNVEDLKKITIEATGFEINAEILFKLVFSGKKFVEIPAPLTHREFGISKLDYKKEIVKHGILIIKIIKWKLFGF